MEKIILEVQAAIIELNKKINAPLWSSWEFWISTCIGIIGLILSFRAMSEAKKAKEAAMKAGESIQIQSITIELSEILHSLQSINEDIKFREARNILTHTQNKLRRFLASYKEIETYRTACANINTSLDRATQALAGVKPSGSDSDPGVVYYGIEGSFSCICGDVSELMGLFERRAIDGEVK